MSFAPGGPFVQGERRSRDDPELGLVAACRCAHRERPRGCWGVRASEPTPRWATSERTGDEALNFALHPLDGDTFRLEEHRGEVVVNVWATWCPPCRVERPGFVDLQRELGDEGVQFVGIAVDRQGAEAVQPFVEEQGVNVPQIGNPSVAARYFPGEVVPRTYLIDKQGRIRYRHSGVLLKWALRDALETLAGESNP